MLMLTDFFSLHGLPQGKGVIKERISEGGRVSHDCGRCNSTWVGQCLHAEQRAKERDALYQH